MAARSSTHTFDDPTVPHPARRYNYWLGGRENYKVDRASGDAVAAAMPSIRVGIAENRAFLRRAVRFMAAEGIRQLIDIGPGIPAPDCSHEVAQAVAPETRVLYVDNDPVVIAYSRALLRSAALPAADDELELGVGAVVALVSDDGLEAGTAPDDGLEPDDGFGLASDDGFDLEPDDGFDLEPDDGFDLEPDDGFDADPASDHAPARGVIGHVLADLCDPERILSNAELRAVIDFDQPIGLLMVAVAHFCVMDDEVYAAVGRLVDLLPSGSIVAFSHAATDYLDPRTKSRVDAANRDHRTPFQFRYTFEIARFAGDMEILEPGIVPISLWRAEDEPAPRPTASDTGIAGWVARKH